MAVQVDLLELPIIEEASESTHHAAVEVVVAIVFVMVDHIEVTANDRGAWPIELLTRLAS
jgi:hypothetical protein